MFKGIIKSIYQFDLCCFRSRTCCLNEISKRGALPPKAYGIADNWGEVGEVVTVVSI